MQTLIDTELIKFQGWMMRVRQAKKPKRLLLLIHGFTGDENSMWVFARGLSFDYWMIAPRAPLAADTSGYTWRPIHSSDSLLDSGKDFGKPSLEQLRPSAEALMRLVDEYQASTWIDAGSDQRQTIDMMGFSQGAVMCNILSFLYPQRIRKVGILAGFIPSGLEDLIPNRPLEGKEFFVAHGVKDETVTIDRARHSVALLEQAGARVTYCEDEVGHKVSADCLVALKNFFRD